MAKEVRILISDHQDTALSEFARQLRLSKVEVIRQIIDQSIRKGSVEITHRARIDASLQYGMSGHSRSVAEPDAVPARINRPAVDNASRDIEDGPPV